MVGNCLSTSVRLASVMVSALVTCCVLCCVGCEGLNPSNAPVRTEIRGSVTYVGGPASWPADSIYDIRVAAFDSIPTSPDQVIKSILGGGAVFSNTLAERVATSEYVVQITTFPRTFTYVVVAVRNGPSPLNDWIMAAVYSPSADPTKPGQVTITEGEIIAIDFTVDFDNLTPQPF